MSPKRQIERTDTVAGSLFDRVVAILEQSLSSVVRVVNSNMVIAYWLIGREIVQELQGGQERAEYGEKLVEDLSARLTKKYGKGFSTTNLRYFRTFYQAYSDRKPEIRHTACDESGAGQVRNTACGVLEDLPLAVEKTDGIKGFSANLVWSHYRTLMLIEERLASGQAE